ncbi:MAG: DUF2490 domain-containing protein [Methylobacterium frigidaeris]
MVRGTILLASGLSFAASALPCAAQVAADEQLWVNATVLGGVDRFAHFAEVQPRFDQGISRLGQLVLRPAIGWKLGDRLAIYQGYAHVETSPPGARAFSEDRSFQQVSWEVGRFMGVNVSSRTRFEQRWQSNGRDAGFRMRELLRASYPLTESGGGISALGWVETFVALNDTDWGARAGLDRVRTFVGLEIPVAGKSTIEIGYMNQTVNARARVETHHIVSLGLFYRH